MKKRNYGLLYGVFAIFLVLVFGTLVRIKDGPILFDTALMDVITSHRSKVATVFMKGVTFLGSKYLLILSLIILSVYYINSMERRKAWLVINSVVVSFSLNALLKRIFIRTRPTSYMIIKQGGYSFPSGHSMLAMSFYTSITYIVLMKIKNPNLRRMLWTLNFLIVFSIGYSRMYLGVHWPSDIIAGYLMGFLIFILGKEFIKE